MEDIISIVSSLKSVIVLALLMMALYYSLIIGNRYVGESSAIDIKKKTFIKLIFSITVLIFLYKVFSGGGFISTVVYTVAIALIIAYFLNPLVGILEKKKIGRGFGVLIIYLGMFFSIYLLMKTIGPRMGDEVGKLVSNTPTYINDIYDFGLGIYEKYSPGMDSLPINMESVEEGLSDTLDSIKTFIGNSIVNVANATMRLFSRFVNLILIPVLTFYFLKDKDKYKDKIGELVPKNYRKDIFKLSKDIDKELGNYIRGQLLVCLFIGVMTSIALLIIGIDFALIIGIFAGIFNIIPYLGPVIGLIPAVIFAALEDPSKIIWVVISMSAIQQIESSFVSPKIVGDSVGLHPTVVMIAVLIGGGYFGLIGMLLAVPIVASSRVIYRFIKVKLSKMNDETILEKMK